MDFPVFFMPYIGNRMLIAIIGIIHIMISHGCAIGGSLMFVLMEYKALSEKNEKWLNTCKKITKLILIITTSLGALTGVGIWFSTAVVSPYGIGYLLRVFFWAWFFEWIVFIIELLLILIYFFTFDKVNKETHFRIGIAYVIASYLTMFIIVGILSAMLTPDKWLTTKSFFDGFFNPNYIPQLLVRIFLAPVLGAGFVLFFFQFFKMDKEFNNKFSGFFGKVLSITSILLMLTSINYYQTLPLAAKKIFPIALTTKAFLNYVNISFYLVPGICVILMIIGFILQFNIKFKNIISIIPIILLLISVAQIERVREFIRKPYIISNYLYSNGILKEQVEFFKAKGILPFIKFKNTSTEKKLSDIDKGNLIFKVECANCHTYYGINSIFDKTKKMNEKAINNFIKSYSKTHPFMPPFAGTEQERNYLTKFLLTRGEKKWN